MRRNSIRLSKTDLSPSVSSSCASDWENESNNSSAQEYKSRVLNGLNNKYFYNRELRTVPLDTKKAQGQNLYTFLDKQPKRVYKDYIMVEAINRSSKRMYLAKMYKVKHLKANPNLRKQVNLEIQILKNLKDSKCLLPIKEVYETNQHLCIIYQHAKPLPSEDFITKTRFAQIDHLSPEQLRQLEIEVLIAISEINSLGYSLAVFSTDNIWVNKTGYKLADFRVFAKIGEKITKKIYSKSLEGAYRNVDQNQRIREDLASLSTDSWMFGVLLLRTFSKAKKLNLYRKERKLDSGIVRVVNEASGLNSEQKDLLSNLLQRNQMLRINIMEVILHDYFKDYICINYQVISKVRACFRNRVKMAKSRQGEKSSVASRGSRRRKRKSCFFRSKNQLSSVVLNPGRQGPAKRGKKRRNTLMAPIPTGSMSRHSSRRCSKTSNLHILDVQDKKEVRRRSRRLSKTVVHPKRKDFKGKSCTLNIEDMESYSKRKINRSKKRRSSLMGDLSRARASTPNPFLIKITEARDEDTPKRRNNKSFFLPRTSRNRAGEKNEESKEIRLSKSRSRVRLEKPKTSTKKGRRRNRRDRWKKGASTELGKEPLDTRNTLDLKIEKRTGCDVFSTILQFFGCAVSGEGKQDDFGGFVDEEEDN